MSTGREKKAKKILKKHEKRRWIEKDEQKKTLEENLILKEPKNDDWKGCSVVNEKNHELLQR